MVSTGLAGPGGAWDGAIMNLNECLVPRGARDPVTHVLQPDPVRWPHGLASLADYFHSKGLRAGIYTDVAAVTCAGYEGSGPSSADPEGHWPLDALTFAQWGFDLVEADFCNIDNGEPDLSLYTRARDAIAAATAATGRVIELYVCSWGDNATWGWAPEVANLQRNTGDICSPGSIAWEDILSNFGNTVVNSGTPPRLPGLPGTGAGAWNDPDMLGTGMPGISDVEGRSQFSLWCLLGAPLFLSADIRNMTAATFATVSNREAIAISQQASRQGVRVFSPSGPAPAPPEGAPFAFTNVSYTRDFGTSFAFGNAAAGGSLQLLSAVTNLVPTGLCATTPACAAAPGTPVYMAPCASASAACASWAMNASNGSVVFAGASCLEALDPVTQPAAQIVLGECTAGAASQTWSFQDYSGRLSLAPGTFGERHPAFGALAPQDIDMFMKELDNGDVALAILNRSRDAAGPQTVDLTRLGFAPAQRVQVRDVWAAATTVATGTFITRAIESHETLLLRLASVASSASMAEL